MSDKNLTTRIWAKTLKKLRLLSILTSKTIVVILDELANQELTRLGKEDLIKELDNE